MWSRFTTAYRSAVSSLRNTRRDFTVAREEQRRLYGVKRPKESTNGHESAKKKKCVTWTQKFVCLATTNMKRVPNAPYKCLLEAAGFGEKKVVISDVECSTSEFHDQLVESYPKLAIGGGFEFPRCIPNTRDLELIPFETASVPRLLKQRVGNGRLYIRPIQKDLPMDPAQLELEEDKVSREINNINGSLCVCVCVRACTMYVLVRNNLFVDAVFHVYRLNSSALPVISVFPWKVLELM